METQLSCPSLGASPRPAALSTAPEHETMSLLDQPRFSQPRGACGQVETVKKPGVKSFFTRSFVFFFFQIMGLRLQNLKEPSFLATGLQCRSEHHPPRPKKAASRLPLRLSNFNSHQDKRILSAEHGGACSP